jgi:hypothetical protein
MPGQGKREEMDTNQVQNGGGRSTPNIRKTVYQWYSGNPNPLPDAIDRYPVIIQHFLGVPVRFFRLDFEINFVIKAMVTRKSLQTWAIPLADIALAVNYPENLIRGMIQSNLKFFLEFWKVDFLTDNHGRHQNIILIAIEMLSALTVKIQAPGTNNRGIRKRARQFQRWMAIVLNMIRIGKLKPMRIPRSIDFRSKYVPLLSIPSGREHKNRVCELARGEGRSNATIYRHLKFIRGSNIITSKGVPRRRRIVQG